MRIKMGCDLVNIARFRKVTRRGGQAFLERVFSPVELSRNASMESLAGVFAAKEAIIKALGLKSGEWDKIEISKDRSGRPEIKLVKHGNTIVSQDINISHDGDYAMAVAAFLMK